ncbi:stas domain-containing protein [Mycobacterium rhizamassiliense]|jgi:anti-anti-sigma factor|uniref:Stas domain-containing protein n=1 Tax=Mycobacterium rhizamassiliense TaxID=1841860 RepID=A0A2U3NLQ2_9MYCO|nr:STAS domain-containing protein [Mycobacterium rhizamassiliense]SPM32430.1 stas domain-containing protein [Mycobacterium rhizamassiliense]
MTALPDTYARFERCEPRNRYLIDCGAAQLHVHARGTATVLRLEGDIDVSNANLIGQAIRRFCRLNAPLILDVSHLDFLGVAGLRMLLTLNQEIRHADLHCSVVGGAALRHLTRVFIDHGLPIVDSVSEAMAAVDDRITARRLARSGALHQREPQREKPYAAIETITTLSALG